MLANGVFIKVNKNMCSVLDVAPGGGGGVSVRVRNFHVPRLTVHLDLCSLRPSFRFQNPPCHHLLHPSIRQFIRLFLSLPTRKDLPKLIQAATLSKLLAPPFCSLLYSRCSRFYPGCGQRHPTLTFF